jgi:hypothetical protein
MVFRASPIPPVPARTEVAVPAPGHVFQGGNGEASVGMSCPGFVIYALAKHFFRKGFGVAKGF